MVAPIKKKPAKRPVPKKKPAPAPAPAQKKPRPAPGSDRRMPRPMPSGLALVAPGDEPKSGCLNCPLLCMAEGFNDELKSRYALDADKIVGKLKEPHTVHSHNVRESWEEVDVMFVGEAPGGNEDKQGKAFVGASGSILRRSILEYLPDYAEKTTVGGKDVIEVNRIAITNAVRCRPPLNKTPTKVMVRACSPELIREIKARKPKVVVVTGNVPLELLTGHTGVTLLHGKMVPCSHPDLPEDLKVMACVHPAYILRMGTDEWLAKWAEVFESVAAYLKGDYEELPGPGEYRTLDDVEDVLSYIRRVSEDRDADDPVAFDTETGSLKWWHTEFPPLACISLSDREGEGVTIPLDHEAAKWNRADRRRIIAAFKKWFESDVPKVAQNGKYDVNHIRAHIGAIPRCLVRDTMATHLILDERRGTHGLKMLAFQFTGMGGYEKPLDDYIASNKDADPENGGSYSNISGDILFPYAAMDADVTKRVDHALIAEPDYVNNPRFRALAEKFLPSLSEVLADMEWHGAQIDADVVEALDVEYSGLLEKHTRDIRSHPVVCQFEVDEIAAGATGKRKNDVFEFNPRSVPQLRKLLFEKRYFGHTPTELTDSGFEVLVARYNRLSKNNAALKFDEVVYRAIADGEWDHFSTKADVLNEYRRQGNDLVESLLSAREVSTLYGTFIEPLRDLLDPAGCVHGTFNIWGTATGRLSSSNPNLQNIPNKGGGKIKRAYVSRFGDEGLLLQLDYSQIELRVAACWYKEPQMIKAYREGADIHMLTAVAISGMSPAQFKKLDKAEQKAWRTRAKRVNFGIIYGIGPPGLQVTLRKDGVHQTIEECAELRDRFLRSRPGLKKGMEATERFAQRNGYLESFTGRYRRLPEVTSPDQEIVSRALRQSVNFPIQSGAADMTLMSLVLIHREMQRRGLRSIPVLTVHDSIVFDCHVDEFHEVATLAKTIMEDLPRLSDQVLPGVDWKWLKVPIKADCEIGPNWGQMVEFDPLVLGRDKATGPLFVDDGGETLVARNPVDYDELWEVMDFRLAA